MKTNYCKKHDYEYPEKQKCPWCKGKRMNEDWE